MQSFVFLNIIISYIFPENFIEIYQVSQKIWTYEMKVFDLKVF